jgi:hypothetical protein
VVGSTSTSMIKLHTSGVCSQLSCLANQLRRTKLTVQYLATLTTCMCLSLLESFCILRAVLKKQSEKHPGSTNSSGVVYIQKDHRIALARNLLYLSLRNYPMCNPSKKSFTRYQMCANFSLSEGSRGKKHPCKNFQSSQEKGRCFPE